MASKLKDLLDPKHVDLSLDVRTREEALRKIVDVMATSGDVREPAKFLEEVIARENANSTLAENGVAFPHARTNLVGKITVGVGRSRVGIPFGPNNEAAHLIFLVGVPKRHVNDYLICLGTLARAVNDDGRREALLRARTATEFIDVLEQVESI